MPLNAESVAENGAAGAGGGKNSAGLKFVGRKVPDTIWLVCGRPEAASSSKVSVTLFTGFGDVDELPASDITMTRWPVGLTSSPSTSAGNVCERLLSVTVTLLTEPATPETRIEDG